MNFSAYEYFSFPHTHTLEYKSNSIYVNLFAQTAGAVEYNDCFSAEGVIPH